MIIISHIVLQELYEMRNCYFYAISLMWETFLGETNIVVLFHLWIQLHGLHFMSLPNFLEIQRFLKPHYRCRLNITTQSTLCVRIRLHKIWNQSWLSSYVFGLIGNKKHHMGFNKTIITENCFKCSSYVVV